MRVFGMFMLLISAAGAAHADRFVLKDNTIRVGKLTGVRDGNLLIMTDGRTGQIPVSNVTLVIFENGGGQPVPLPTTIDPATNVSTPNPNMSASLTVEGLKVDLERCAKQGGTAVVCNFRITNLQPDREVTLSADDGGGPFANSPSTYVDDQGMKRNAQSATLGTGQGRRPSTFAVTDVAVRGIIVFPAVEPGVNGLAKLWLYFAAPQKLLTFEFRRVPLQGNQ